MDSFEQLGSNQGIAETTFYLLQIMKDQGMLGEVEELFGRISLPPYQDPAMLAHVHMINAIRSEFETNWGTAEEFWKEALQFEDLSVDSRLVCLGALAESAFRVWFYDQTDQTLGRLTARLEEWQRTSETSGRSGSLCPVYLLRARFALAAYQFNEMEEWLTRCERIANEAGLTRYQIQARKASEQLLEHKDRIETLYNAEMLLLPEDRGKLIQQYIRKVVLFLKEDE
ncbi:MAG: hypothetical protein ACFFDT_00010 [Candidatus Hodarchaeota archaeon]